MENTDNPTAKGGVIGEQSSLKQSINYNEYMKKYMRRHYDKNKETIRKYRNSINYKKKHNTPEEIVERYGIFLHSAMTILELMDDMPDEIIDQLMLEYSNKKNQSDGSSDESTS